ncbi:MAG: hypothetical protein ACYCFI_00040 [Enterococcus faecalis]
MKKFTLTMMTLGLVATLGLAGCGKQEKKATTSSEKTEVTLPTKDRSGKEITLPKEATKIISLVPSTTEVIEDLGKTDQLIAVDTQSSTMIIIGNPRLNHRYRKGFYSLFKTLQQNPTENKSNP